MSKGTFLRNPKTGQIVRWNPVLAKRTDLFPCPAPWQKPGDDLYVEIPGHDADAMSSNPEAPPVIPGMPDPASEKLQTDDASDDLAAKKAEGEALVKAWFGRDVARVTKDNLIEFATEKGLTGIDGTKLEMVFQIKDGIEKQDE